MGFLNDLTVLINSYDMYGMSCMTVLFVFYDCHHLMDCYRDMIVFYFSIFFTVKTIFIYNCKYAL